MTAAPMLADFAIRLAFGLAVAMLLISWRAVPLPFFRTQAQVILGVLVLGRARSGAGRGLDRGCLGGRGRRISAYSSAVAWGLGLPRFGLGTAAVAAPPPPAGWPPRPGRLTPGLWSANAASRLSLGIPAGSHAHGDAARSLLPDGPGDDDRTFEASRRPVGMGHCWCGASSPRSVCGPQTPAALGGVPCRSIRTRGIFLAVRWGMGFVAAAISTYLTWKTAEIRSTQSATGILYITMIFVLFGELTSMVLAGRSGVI